MKDFLVWLKRIGHRWCAIITGPAITFLLWMIQKAGLTMIPDWIYWLIGFSGFVVASFLAWKEEYRKVNALINPNFKFEPRSFILNDFVETNGGSGITLWFCVKNFGGKSGIQPDSWHVKAIIKGQPHDGNSSRGLWQNGFPYRDRLGAEMGIANFYIEDALFIILSEPLDQNKSILGLMRVQFPAIEFQALASDATEIEVCCLDTFGNPWSFRESLKQIPCGFTHNLMLKSTDIKYAQLS